MNPVRMNEQLQKIVGMKLQYICRSCELVEFGFGPLTRRTDQSGNSISVAAYHLHLQCPFRIADASGIRLSSDDLWRPSAPGAIPDPGCCDSCLFDVKITATKATLEQTFVRSIAADQYGDLLIELSDFTVSVLNTSCDGNEAWRFFKTGSVPHMVIRGLSFCTE